MNEVTNDLSKDMQENAVKTAVKTVNRKSDYLINEQNKAKTQSVSSSAPETKVSIGNISFKNPFIAASGTYGFGREASEFLDLAVWGGICSKAITLEPREGNPAPRVAETPSGMLNAVGLQNPGVDEFLKTELPFMLEQDTVTIVMFQAARVPI